VTAHSELHEKTSTHEMSRGKNVEIARMHPQKIGPENSITSKERSFRPPREHGNFSGFLCVSCGNQLVYVRFVYDSYENSCILKGPLDRPHEKKPQYFHQDIVQSKISSRAPIPFEPETGTVTINKL
jgi:hypothetical protein